MADIKKYKSKKLRMLIAYIIITAFWFYFTMKLIENDSRLASMGIVLFVWVVCFVEYKSISTKLEILKILEAEKKLKEEQSQQ